MTVQLSYQVRVYLHGLIAALINGFASGIVLVVADPSKFNLFDGGASRLGATSCVFAIFGAATYLKDHPLPDPVKDTDYRPVVNAQVEKLQGTGTGDGTKP